jgi:predicted ATPase
LLKQVKIKAFKSIQEAEIALGELNVFVGANGSGKSNILEAFGVLGAAAAGRIDDEALLRRGVRPGVPALYKSSFRKERARDAIRFGAFFEDTHYEVELNNPLHEPKPAWQFKTERLFVNHEKKVGRSPRSQGYQDMDPSQGLVALKAVELSPKSASAAALRRLREFAIYAPNTPTLRGIVQDPQTRAPVGLAGGRLAEAVAEIQRRALTDEALGDALEDLLELIDWTQSVDAREGAEVPLSPSIPRQHSVLTFRDRFMADGRNQLSAYDASEGALYLLFAWVLAVHAESPRLLAIDNFDAALNPRLVREFSRRLAGWVLGSGRQLLLTCHNPLVLDALDLQDDRVRLFVVERSSRGLTLIRRVQVDPALLARAKEGWSLSRLWVMGHLGGVPNV